MSDDERPPASAPAPEAKPAAKPVQLSFEKEFQMGLLPTVHIMKGGDPIPFVEMHDSHLYMAWKWFSGEEKVTLASGPKPKAKPKKGR